MNFKVKITPIAKNHIKFAVEYYTIKASKKVAKDFLLDFQKTISKLRNNPYYQIYYRDNRGIPLRKFPYLIFFKVEETTKQIIIRAVFNTNQDSNKWP